MKPIVLLSLGLLLVGGPLGHSVLAHDPSTAPKSRASSEDFKPHAAFGAVCTGVIEADLITIKPDRGGSEEVYLLGADTPEPGQGEWTDRAREVTKSMILNRKIKVVIDEQPRANCGRLRAYIHTADGAFLNLKLIEQGYASVLSKRPNLAHDAAFKLAEAAAKTKGLGIWSEKGGLAVLPGAYRKQHGKHEDRPAHSCQPGECPAPKP